MAFNKAKAMESALKALNQGKVAQAIQEYQTILRSDPNDQVVLMTVGDLFVRQGNMPQAIEYFERLAQRYLNDGFNSKAIAIYKKISKLAPAETQPLEKLANLYVQQGILSEARPIFLQLAEAHLKANQTPRAVEVLRRLLEVEPDNPRVQRRLAELYMAMGQKKEAAQTFLQFARYLHERGDANEALKIADAALAAEPGNSDVLLLKARLQGASGDADAAMGTLSKLQGSASNAEILGLQVDLCLKNGKPDHAIDLLKDSSVEGAEKFALISRLQNALLDAGEDEKALRLADAIREPAIESKEQEPLAKLFLGLSERLKDRSEPLEWLVDLYRRTGNNDLHEAQLKLADAFANAGDFSRAEKTLNDLLEHEPDNELARQRLNQVRQKLGRASDAPVQLEQAPIPEPAREPLIGPSPAAPVAAAPSSASEPILDEETQQFITQSLTDVDLFSSYGLTQKAVQILENILVRVPGHAPTLERLLDLTLGSGNDRRTAELAIQLEQIYTQRGDIANAERVSELRNRFQRASGATDEELAAAVSESSQPIPAEAQVPDAPPEFSISPAEPPSAEAESPTPPVAAVPAADPSAEAEIDLSDEWAELAAESDASAKLTPVQDQPSAAGAPEELTPATAAADTESEFELELVSSSQGKTEANSTESLLEQLVAEVEGLDATPATTSAPPASQANARTEAIAEPPAKPEAKKPAEPDPVPAAIAAGFATDGLSEVFQEFREELGEMAEDKEEDLETHYNLGIAYREMGLLDEAIGEFQKVSKAVQAGHPFPYAMQCSTLLGLTFMDKNEPKVAALWYQRALALPDLEPETILALRYDLGVAEQQAGDAGAALNSFRQVYAMNIDYRDVAERIAALQKH